VTAPRDRYAQCDETCTTDCGACKGQGRPKAEEASLAVALDAVEDASRELTDAYRESIDAARAVTRARAAHDVALAAYYAACAEMNS